MELGIENKKKVMWAAGLGIAALLILVYQFMPSSSTSASAPMPATPGLTTPTTSSHPTARRSKAATATSRGKQVAAAQSLDPTLRLQELAATEQIKYEGTGRNIFVSQAEPPPTPVSNGTTDHKGEEQHVYVAPQPPPPTPIPLKFFGFASQPGEPKKIFLQQGEDVFVAGEGDIVNRRYKVIRISNAAVEIQDMVGSGPPQSIPLTQG